MDISPDEYLALYILNEYSRHALHIITHTLETLYYSHALHRSLKMLTVFVEKLALTSQNA